MELLSATAAAEGPEAARRGAWGARTVRATAATERPGGEGGWKGVEGQNSIHDNLLRYIYRKRKREKTLLHNDFHFVPNN